MRRAARSASEVARALEPVLRPFESRKAAEVAALLGEIEPLCAGSAREHVICDLACGKSYLLHALFALARPRARYFGVDRDERLAERARAAAAQLGMPAEFVAGPIATAPLPERPDLVLALHACGEATDEVLARAAALGARHVLAAPCCHHRPARARRVLDEIGFPRQGVLRGRLADLLTDARRTLSLEAAGYEVVVVEFVPAQVTPQNLLLRARRVGPSRRADAARAALERLARLGPDAPPGPAALEPPPGLK